ncbi:YhcN/YlaJ family sporulation lipoprotein [Bacillus sp. B1-b2]|uniref:YhcN/YlaJ family sporulation lipoprotein n=1 Tax=Bacillus sp. B1-b2 TaxID=2653201 RepID=UPI001262A6F1|nr:YhcN/YlaJ family sporulation lipoprotein [Bacillus sp. B1-b2]KAB7669298.1 YhcN/YlaJ family sporulation lipoprotein [Bacillus sp. B1-b2]
MKKVFLLASFLVLLAGCNKNVDEYQSTETENNPTHVRNVNNSTIKEVDRKTGQEIAQRLVSLSTSIENVNDATAVVIGKYAIVGLDVNKDLDRSEVGSLKYAVTESLKNDPDGANALVVADPDITARLKEIGKDIDEGHPIKGIFNELADITGRIIPEIPSDNINREPMKGIEKSDEKLNTGEEKKLEEEQDEQSNHHITD